MNTGADSSVQPLNRTEEDVKSIAKTIAEHYEDEELRSNFVDLALQL